MPANKVHLLHPRQSLRRLRTALGASPSPPPSDSPTSPRSAGTATSAGSRLSTFSFANTSSLSIGSALHSRRIIRRKKSMVEVEQEEERNLVGDELMSLVEPRPSWGPALGGIEEVLDGRI